MPYKKSSTRRTPEKLEATTKIVAKIQNQTDGLTAALVATTAEAEHAKGKLEGAAEANESNGSANKP